MVVLRNGGESPWDGAIEYSEELNCFYFPPLPTTFPLSQPPFPQDLQAPSPHPSSSNSTVRYAVASISMIYQPPNHKDTVDPPAIGLAFSVEYRIQNRGGALDVIPEGRLIWINGFEQQLKDIVHPTASVDLAVIQNGIPIPGEIEIVTEAGHEDIVDPVLESVDMKQYLIQYVGGAFDMIPTWEALKMNGLEVSKGQSLSTTLEPSLIFQTKLSIRVWQGHCSEWEAEFRCGWNWLTTGTFETAANPTVEYEPIIRLRGGKDQSDYPFPEVFLNEKNAEPTTAPGVEIQTLENFGLECREATGNDGHCSEWEAEFRCEWNWLSTGTFETAANPTFEYEPGIRLRGGNDQFDYPLPEVFPNEKNAEPTTAPRGEIQTLENPDDDFGMECSEATGNEPVIKLRGGKDQFDYPFPEVLLNEKNAEPTTAPRREIPTLESPDDDFGLECSEATGNEPVIRLRGGKDQFDYPFPEVFLNEKNAEPTTAPRVEIQTLENPDDDFGLGCSKATGNDEVEAVGIGSEGTGKCVLAGQAQLDSGYLGIRKIIKKNPRGEGRNKKANIVGMLLKDAANYLKVSRSKLKNVCREYGSRRWPPRKLISRSRPNDSPVVVNQEGISQLNSGTLPSDQDLAAIVDANSVVKEIPPPHSLLTAQQEKPDEDFSNGEVEAVGMGSEGIGEGVVEEGQLNSVCLEKGKSKVNTPGGESGNKKNSGVRITIPLEDILQVKGMLLKAAAKHLKVSRSTLKRACREYNISRWPPREEHKVISPSRPNEPPTIDQEQIPQLNSGTLPSDQDLAATVDANSVVKEIPPLHFLPTAQQEKPDEDFCNGEVEAVGMGSEGTVEGVVEGQLNSEWSEKGKSKVNTPGGESGNKKNSGVRITIPLEDILQAKGMLLKDAAKHLEVSRSTLKRACREYNIYRWPPREEHKVISPSRPIEPPTVDQEQIPQLNSDKPLHSNQVPAVINGNSVTIKARYEKVNIIFDLSWPWRRIELEQEVEKRLEIKGTYSINYKDEDNDLILIACDADLQRHICRSSLLGTGSIEVFLEPK